MGSRTGLRRGRAAQLRNELTVPGGPRRHPRVVGHVRLEHDATPAASGPSGGGGRPASHLRSATASVGNVSSVS